MKILITGAGGFIGRKLISLLQEHEVIALDSQPGHSPTVESVRWITGDLRDGEVLEQCLAKGVDAIAHLATVTGSGAEQDPELAWQVNIEGTRQVMRCAQEQKHKPRLVFASSIAVYGSDLPEVIDEETPTRPQLLYGAHKLMMEHWIATQARRGSLRATSLRIPGVVARPPNSTGMKTAFLSEIFWAAKAGRTYELPVSPDGTSLLASVEAVSQGIKHVLLSDNPALDQGITVNLPALCVPMSELVKTLQDQCEIPEGLISYHPDAELQRAFAQQGTLDSRLASRLGIAGDTSLTSLVESVLVEIERVNC